ncbi:hypothetical protein D3C83_47550 [compost metagenome]
MITPVAVLRTGSSVSDSGSPTTPTTCPSRTTSPSAACERSTPLAGERAQVLDLAITGSPAGLRVAFGRSSMPTS